MVQHNCLLCDKSVDADQLDLHISVQHFHHMPFRCEKCDFRGPTSSTLTDHFLERGHFNELQIVEAQNSSSYLTDLVSLISTSCQAASVLDMSVILDKLELPTTTADTAAPPNDVQIDPVGVATNSIGNLSRPSLHQGTPKLPSWIRPQMAAVQDNSDHSDTSSSEESAEQSEDQESVDQSDLSDVVESSDSSGNENENSAVWRRVKPEPINVASGSNSVAKRPAKKIPHSANKKVINKPHVGQVEVRAETVDGQIVFTCQMCLKSFGSRSVAINHLHIHRPPRFACGFCDKKFTYKQAHQKHISRIHGKEPSRKCSKAALSKRKQLKPTKRAAITVGRGGFRCLQCGKRFAQRRHLISHSFIHQHIRLSCDQCDATYSRADGLRTHKMIKHSGKVSKKFKCPQCRMAFVLKARLQQHMFVHGNAIHSCDKCPAEYKHRRGLTDHVRQKHSGCPE